MPKYHKLVAPPPSRGSQNDVYRTSSSVYVNTRPLTRGDLILLADKLISNLLAWIGDLILVAKSIT